MAYAHLNADFPLTAYNDATTAARTSDHDVAVGYFALPAPVLAGSLSLPPLSSFGSVAIGSASAGQVFTFTNTGEGPIAITGVTATGDFAVTTTCGATLAISSSCTANVVFKPTAAGARTGTLTVASNVAGGNTFDVLTGTGLMPDFSVADASGKTATTATVAAGASVAAPLTFTSLMTFAGTVTVTCAAPATPVPTGVTCAAPAPFTLTAAAPVVQSVTFTTTSRTQSSGFAGGGSSRTMLLGLGLSGVGMLLAARARKLGGALRLGGLLVLALVVSLAAGGCSSSNVNTNGTPAGSYVYTVTATSGTLSHVETVTLTVQ